VQVERTAQLAEVAEWQTRRIQKRSADDSVVPGADIPEGSETRDDLDEPTGPAVAQFSEAENHSTPTTDPVEAALANAITRASEAGEWTVVTELGRELGERRRARTAPGVPSLEAERARRRRR